MKKLFNFPLILGVLLMASPSFSASNQRLLVENVFGFYGYSGNGGIAMGAPFALNAANTWIAFSFIAEQTKTISSIKVATSAIAGTQGNISCSLNIYSDTGTTFIPDASVAGPITVTNLAAGWWTFASVNFEVQANTKYWIVLKNTAVAPTVDYPTFKWSDVQNFISGTGDFWGSIKTTTTDAGTSWSTVRPRAGLWFISFSDDTYQGIPETTVSYDNTNKVYDTRLWGAKFTTYRNVKINLKYVYFPLRQTLSVGQTAYIKIFQGTTLIGTSNTVPTAAVPTSAAQVIPFFFSTPVVLQANTTYRIVCGVSSGGDTSNFLYGVYAPVVDAAADKSILPFGGWYSTYFNGSTWTDTETKAPYVSFSGDVDNAFKKFILFDF